MLYQANDLYSATLTQGYTVGDTTLYVDAVPTLVPTIVTVSKGTADETQFIVTNKTTNTLTGVSRLKGANRNLDLGSAVTCLNNSEFINQYLTAIFNAEGLQGLISGTDGGSTDDYAISLSVAPTDYDNLIGVPLTFSVNTANTGPATLDVNSLGAKAIKKNVSDALETGDILADQMITVVYDGTNFQLVSNIETRTVYSTPTELTDGATITIDHSLNTKFYVTLGGNRTLAFSNLTIGKPILLDIIQDATGSRTVTWPGTTTDTVTMTIANPGVVTTTKDMPTCTPIVFTTTGALPTGITAGTRYYWVRTASTTGNVATSIANAQAGTVIETTGTQSGTHTMTPQIRWGSTDTLPTLTTGKYRIDSFGFMPRDVTNGIVLGYTVGQDL